MSESNQKHTPGPWEVVPGTLGDEDRSISATSKGGNPIWIGRVYGGGITAMPDPRTTANARLIAAAPELLEAATAFVADVRAMPSDYEHGTKEHGLAVCLNTRNGDSLERAIAKARGE